MAEQVIPKIELTDDPLTNIIKMAPYLSEGDQRMVLGVMIGVCGTMGKDQKKAGQKKEVRKQVSKPGLVYAKEVPMIKVKLVKEINGKGTPLQTVIQYWTKDGILVAEGRVNQFDEPEMNG